MAGFVVHDRHDRHDRRARVAPPVRDISGAIGSLTLRNGCSIASGSGVRTGA
jgi:hypothetical protein